MYPIDLGSHHMRRRSSSSVDGGDDKGKGGEPSSHGSQNGRHSSSQNKQNNEILNRPWRRLEQEGRMEEKVLDETTKRELDRERLREAEEQVSRYLANVNFENSWLDDLEDIPLPEDLKGPQITKDTKGTKDATLGNMGTRNIMDTKEKLDKIPLRKTLTDRKITPLSKSRGEQEREANTVTVSINFRLSVDKKVDVIPVKLCRGPS